jgi:predicted MFS family arabinose efflux permease
MKINTWWYFAMISISGVFAVTFSVVFAYVADVTDENDRSAAYGLVSATFAASLVTSPALGAYLEQVIQALNLLAVTLNVKHFSEVGNSLLSKVLMRIFKAGL